MKFPVDDQVITQLPDQLVLQDCLSLLQDLRKSLCMGRDLALIDLRLLQLEVRILWLTLESLPSQDQDRSELQNLLSDRSRRLQLALSLCHKQDRNPRPQPSHGRLLT